ncbi:MAG: adenylate/guanylate cyclase domain-containing protein [Ilumatobacter sp.]|nr:adenylate/guanylate cyclase domain-containing protein [Ilumatobacter sp.]
MLFTDIVDSTAHNVASGDRAWLDLLARHDLLAEREIRRRGGRLVKRLGDGLLAVFPLGSDAIDVAVAVVDGATSDLGIGVRATVHVAEVEETVDDVLGLGVTVAARVLGLAGAAEVLVTEAVVELLAGSGRNFSPRGAHELKGVEGSWEVHAVERS